MMKSLRMMMDTPTDSKYSEEKLKLRAECLKILLKTYGNINIKEVTPTRAIYECADEWVEKYVRADGVVAYYKAYFDK